jgi:hypothetical protein
VFVALAQCEERQRNGYHVSRTHYRGYAIEGERRGRIWRLRVRPLRPDLPILGRHSLLRPSWAEGVAEAQARIDWILSG